MLKSHHLCYFFIAFFILVLACASNQFFIYNINSDYLYVYEVANNLTHFKTLAGQNFPAAPYYFPDIFIIFLLQLFTKNISIVHFLYSVLFLFTFCYLIFCLSKQCVNDKKFALMSVVSVLFLCFFITPINLIFLQEWPASHLSSLFFSLFLLLFYIKNRPNTGHATSIISLFFIAFLMFVSDNLVFAQAFFPLSFIIFFDLFFKNCHKKLVISLLILFFFVTLFGARFDLFLAKFDASFSLNISLFRVRKATQLLITMQHAWQIFIENFHLNRSFYLSLFFYNVASFILAMLLFFRKKTPHKNLFTILAFLYLAQICNVLLAILAGKFTDPMHLRYLDTCFIFPSIAFTFVLIRCIHEHFYRKTAYVLLSSLFIMNSITFAHTHHPFLKKFDFQPPYNSFVACIDHLSLHEGLGEYWDVREIRMLSKQQVNMTQINNDLNFFNFIDNDKLFHAKHYDFVVINQNAIISPIPKDQLRIAIGNPDRIVSCGDREIWLYTEKQSNQRLNGFFAQKAGHIHRCL